MKALVGVFATIFTLHADFSYRETTQLTGGVLLRMTRMLPGGGKAAQPVTTIHHLKGNRLANFNEESVQVIDLDRETMTSIDLKNKTYSVITFAELEQAMEAALKKMGQQPAASGAQVDMKAEVKETGNSKQVSGVDAREFLLLLSWQVTDAKSGQKADFMIDNQMFIAKDVPGYDEMRKFYMRMAGKIALSPGMASGALNAMQPNVRQGMTRLAEEMRKLEGVPVETFTKVKMAGQGGEIPDLPETQLPGMKEAMSDAASQTAANEAAYQAARATGGRMGGLAGAAVGGMLGGFGKKKKKQPEAEKTAAPDAAKPAGPASFMESKTTMSDWSNAAVDGSKFEVPAGFKQVEHEMKKLLK